MNEEPKEEEEKENLKIDLDSNQQERKYSLRKLECELGFKLDTKLKHQKKLTNKQLLKLLDPVPEDFSIP